MQQVPGVYHRRVGEILVTALHDGFQDVAMATVLGLPEEEAVEILHASFRPVPRRTAVNAFLIRHGGHTALVDTGCGPAKPTVGFVAANLASAGVAPEAVDTILMTHLHPDHWGGLSNGGQAVFSNAELLVHADELAYWRDDAAMSRMAAPSRQDFFFGGARRALAPYAGRTRTFADGEVFPGVSAVPLPGHTPGHTGFMLASGGRSLLIWGDIIHVQELQVPRPEVVMAVDVDPAQAAETRRRVFDQVATDRQAVAGMHLHFPGFAHVGQDGSGYRLVSDAWSMDLDGDAPA